MQASCKTFYINAFKKRVWFDELNPYLYQKVIEWIPPNARVLDLGTGNGSFLKELITKKNVLAEAVEKDPFRVSLCIEKGLVTFQGDILEGLDQYETGSFDYVFLLGTFQELLSPEEVLKESFRVANAVILAFTNFAYWKTRFQLMFQGTSPKLGDDSPWYETPNIQFFSNQDFYEFCRAKNIQRKLSAYFHSSGELQFLPNLMAEEVLTLLSAKSISD